VALAALIASCTVEATDVRDAAAPPAIRLGLACECPDTYSCELAACGPGASCPGVTCVIACARCIARRPLAGDAVSVSAYCADLFFQLVATELAALPKPRLIQGALRNVVE